MGETALDWNDVYHRRRKIAEKVRNRLGLSWHFDVETVFSLMPITDQTIADEKMWRIPFYVIANRLVSASGGYHVIDHAWWLITRDATAEPWGFVTEPYIDIRKARSLVEELRSHHEAWGIEFEVLSKAESAWLPKSTVPIVVNASPGYLSELLRLGVGAALEELR